MTVLSVCQTAATFSILEGFWCKTQGWRTTPESNDDPGAGKLSRPQKLSDSPLGGERCSRLVDRKHSLQCHLRDLHCTSCPYIGVCMVPAVLIYGVYGFYGVYGACLCPFRPAPGPVASQLDGPPAIFPDLKSSRIRLWGRKVLSSGRPKAQPALPFEVCRCASSPYMGVLMRHRGGNTLDP